MSATFSRESLQAERSKMLPVKHDKIAYTFTGTGGAGSLLGYGDVGILHNLAILFKMKSIDDEFKPIINRFHTIVRTMRRSTHWDWVKPEHINLVFQVIADIHENIDEVVASYKGGEAFLMEQMEEQVASGEMAEGDYIEMANGMKAPHDFITGSDFKKWVAGRAEFYQFYSFWGGMPTVKSVSLPQFNENDGKFLLITSPQWEGIVSKQ